MLNLLTPKEAGQLIYCWYKNINNPFHPETQMAINGDTNSLGEVFMYERFVQNAILSGEIAAIKKPKGVPADKKMYKKAGLSEDALKIMPQQFDYWITFEDLVELFRRLQFIPKEYSHGRDAIVRIIYILSKNNKHDISSEKDLADYLLHEIENFEENEKVTTSLSETTVKSCCREVFDVKQGIIKVEEQKK